jgi:MFS family permease
MSAATDAPSASADRYAAFRHSAFLRYWVQRLLNTLAVQIVSVAVGWQIYDLTRDPFDLGLIGLTQFLPALALVLFTGAAADMFGRRMVMGVSQIIEIVCTAALFFLTIGGLSSATPVFALLVGLGVARAFVGPASSSLIVSLVPQKDFANAISWSTTCWQIGSVTGPVLGGLLYGVSPQAAYGTAAVLLAIAAAFTFAIPKPSERPKLGGHALDDILGGFRYVWSEKIVFGAISLDMFAVLLGGAVALLPVFARDILEVGPWGLGLLRSAPGVGAILAAIWLSGHPIKDHAGALMFAGVALFGCCMILFGVSTVAWLSILALALFGAADMVSVYVREILIQLWTPDEVRGRVNAVNGVFIGASNELGEFRAGMMASWIGPVGAVVFGGVGAIAVAAIWAWQFPALRKMRSLDKGIER